MQVHTSAYRKSEGFPAGGILRFFLYIFFFCTIVCRMNKYAGPENKKRPPTAVFFLHS